MLRIITQLADAKTELWRIRDRVFEQGWASLESSVETVLERVRNQGDRGLQEPWLPPDVESLRSLKVGGSDLDAAYQQISKDLLVAIKQICEQLDYFYRQRLPKAWVHFGEADVTLARRYHPFSRAGLYIDSRQGSGIGSLLMQAIPARIAKVPQVIAMVACERDATGILPKIHPALLVAAQEAGIDEIYKLGGVEAIAALAYGTDSFPKVEVITGSGDVSVTLAKKLLQGTVATDRFLVKSDLIILVDGSAKADVIAADCLAQIDHDPNAALLLLTTDVSLARQIQQIIQDRLPHHSQGILAEKALAHQGLIVILDTLEQGIELINQYAPPSLILAVADPWAIAEKIQTAGTIFLGQDSPKAIGEYLGGSYLSLGSFGNIRYPSQLGVETFLRSTQFIDYSATALNKLSQSLQLIAELEGRSDTIETIKRRIQRNSNSSEF
jgi:histidinol dehydrogenase